jgi:catechol 2,3-dioxygenase-like lactoylglutathione lyase family enzyme
VRTPTFSVEVITLPVSDVEQALRFYVDRVGFSLDVDCSPNDAFRVVQLTPPGSSCSIQIGNGLTDAPAGSLRNVYLVVTDLEAARNRLLERGVEVGEIRHKTPIGAWDGVSHPGSTPRAETMPASPASPIRMTIAGCYRNGATAMCDAVWKLGDVDHARCSRNTREEIRPDTVPSVHSRCIGDNSQCEATYRRPGLFANPPCMQEKFRTRWPNYCR